MENIIDYVIKEALIVIPVLWVIGAWLKRTPHVPDWTIPWALTVLGVAFCLCIVGQSIDGVMQGILVSGAAVLGHQLLVQTISRD